MFGFENGIIEFLLGLVIEGGEKIETALLERGINLENIVLIVLAVLVILVVLCIAGACIWAVVSGFLAQMNLN
ncbi:MAG: hypothetical protein JXA21_21565 [Anaerolineae bacterium]|nr:hypothetical protein [Anaerolineae bacterium]